MTCFSNGVSLIPDKNGGRICDECYTYLFKAHTLWGKSCTSVVVDDYIYSGKLFVVNTRTTIELIRQGHVTNCVKYSCTLPKQLNMNNINFYERRLRAERSHEKEIY